MDRLGAGIVIALVARAALAATPQVVSTSPVRHTMAPAATAISITFDQPLLQSSITAASLRVFGRFTGTKTGPVTFSNGDQTVTLTPTRPFSAGETVIVNLSHDVKASDGSPLRSAGYAFEFTIASAPAARVFEQIDSMSNRTNGNQTRIYGALQADLDGDGWIDLATVNEVSADLRVFMNRADGTGLYHDFLAPEPIGLEASPNEPADFDNDGKIDVVVSATDGGGVWIKRGNGDGTFQAPQIILTGSEPHGVVVLDVDGDGDLDIVEAVEGDDHLALMLNDGTGSFGPPTYFDTDCSGEWGLASGDMNDDGITDVVAGCVNDDKVGVVLGNGDGTFTALPAVDAGGGPWQVFAGDVDGDGDLDVACANSFSANGGMLYNDGTGHLGNLVTVPMPGHTPANDLGDIDGDGDLDWVLSSYGAGLWRIYVNDGHGNFTFDQDIPAPSNPSCAVLLDFDNDGDIDLALSDEIADVVLLMKNTNGPSPLCPPSPATCREPVLAGKASLVMKDRTPDKGDTIQWKWVKGPTTPVADYGDPLNTDTYTLCVYDAGVLRTSATAPPGGLCEGVPCWKDLGTKLLYKNKLTSSDGAQTVKLNQGLVDGKASITFVAKGTNVVLPPLTSYTGPITVQAQRSGGGPCFSATYSPPFLLQDATILKDKAD